jgi:hypothetical protein
MLVVVFNRFIQLLGRNSLYLRKSFLNEDLADIDSESEMLGYGIGVILLNIGMYFVASAVLLSIGIRKIQQKQS